MEQFPKLAQLGDKDARGYWGHLRKLVPHYEAFWQRFVFPLRSANSIWFREGVEPALEEVAITSYSTFLALARARQRIFTKHENYRFIEELYAALQRAPELGIKLVKHFLDYRDTLTNERCDLSPAQLEQHIDGHLKKYRNLLHDAIISMPKEENGQRLIPKPDFIDSYKSWNQTMYHFDREHFVVAAVQLKSDFRATCSALEDVWKRMSEEYDKLISIPRFLADLSGGSASSFMDVSGAPPASGAFYIGEERAGKPSPTRFRVPLHGRFK